jgi:PEGA domain-containing protein
MSRVGLSVVVAAVVGVSLTGCSSALSSNSSSEKLQSLKFESDPMGAEIRTAQGQTCKTPCELTVPSHEQPVTITKDNYVPQTVHSPWARSRTTRSGRIHRRLSYPIRSASCSSRCRSRPRDTATKGKNNPIWVVAGLQTERIIHPPHVGPVERLSVCS